MRHLVLSNKNVDRARVQNRRDQNRPKNQSSKSQKKMQRKSRKENENLQLPLLQIHLLTQKLNQNNHERNCCLHKLFFFKTLCAEWDCYKRNCTVEARNIAHTRILMGFYHLLGE